MAAGVIARAVVGAVTGAAKKYAKGVTSRKAAKSAETAARNAARNEERKAATQALRKKSEELAAIRDDMNASAKRLSKERDEATKRITEAVGNASRQGAMHKAPKTKQ